MASIKAILWKHDKKKDNTLPIAIRITQNRKTKYIFTGKYIPEKEWDATNHKVKKSHPNSARLNAFISAKLTQANNALLEAETDINKPSTLKEVKRKIVNKQSTNSFYEFAKNYFVELEKNKKFSRINSERPILNRIKRFTKDKDLDFKQITPLFLRNFMTFLRGLDSIGERTISNTLVFIRTLYNAAIAQNLAKRESYPFGSGDGRIKIKFPESIKIGLSIEEIQSIERLDLSNNPSQYHARNIWLFSFYLAGMRVGDVLKIKWSDIKDDRIVYRMGKNSKPLSLKIPDKGLPILDYYRPLKQGARDYLFPELKGIDTTDLKAILRKTKTANKKINNYLKQIASLAEIDKKLTMHIARHSFGNISGDKIPIQMLQKLYRHSSITTTINYQQNFMHKEADDALDKVINF